VSARRLALEDFGGGFRGRRGWEFWGQFWGQTTKLGSLSGRYVQDLNLGLGPVLRGRRPAQASQDSIQ